MVSRVIPVDVFDLVIFGGTGDLARRKILPGLYRRFVAGQMPVKDWHAFIHDPALADAIMDRLIHSSHKLALKGDSLRKVKAPRTRE